MLPGPNLLRRTNRDGKVPFLCNSIVTSGAEYGPRTFVTVTRMRYEIVILSTCDSKPWRPHDAGRNLRDESLGRNGRLASAGQRRGANTGLIGAGRRQAWRRDRFPVARWVLDFSGADLSRAAARFAAAKTHRRAHRVGKTGRDSHCDGGSDRPCRAGLLHQEQTAIHDELHDAVSRIYFGAVADPAAVDLQCAA